MSWPAPRGVGDIGNQEAAVIQGDQRDHRGERAARVQALVHRVAALLQREHPNIGVLDREQAQNALTEQVVAALDRFAAEGVGMRQ